MLKVAQQNMAQEMGNVVSAVDTPSNTKRPQKQPTGRIVKADMYIADRFEWRIIKEH